MNGFKAGGYALLALHLAYTAAAGRDSDHVGAYGDPAKLRPQGNVTFSSNDIVRAVVIHPDVVFAAHAQASLAKYMGVLRKTIEEGYGNAGFPETRANVSVNQAEECIAIVIDEGPRYVCADIGIDGNNLLDKNELCRWIDGWHPDSAATMLDLDGNDIKTSAWVDRRNNAVPLAEPLWKIGAPVSFDPKALETIKGIVERAYAEAGRVGVDISVVLQRYPGGAPGTGPSKRLASLGIEIKDEGQPAVVETIEVIGAEKNSRNEVLAALAVKLGMIWNRAEETRVERALWRSARFTKFKVEFTYPELKTVQRIGDKLATAVGGRSKSRRPTHLKITLAEYEKAPRLSESPSPEENALLRLRDWFFTRGQKHEDIWVRAHGRDKSLEVVLGAHGELLGWLTYLSKTSGQQESFALSAGNREFLALLTSERSRLEFAADGGQIAISQEVKVANDKKQPFTYALGYGARSNQADRQQSPCRVANSVAPVVAMAIAHASQNEHPIHCVVNNGVLTVSTKELTLRADAATGAPIELAVTSGPEPVAATIQSGPDLFAARHHAVQALSGNCKNVYDSARPVTSQLTFLFTVAEHLSAIAPREAEEGEPTDAAYFGTLRHFLAYGVWEPVEVLLQDLMAPTTGAFRTRSIATHSDDETEALTVLAATYLPLIADRAFPRGSWPWTLTRELGLAATGRVTYLIAEVQGGLDDGRFGPVVCWILATSSAQLGLTPMATHCADLGLKRNTVEAFRRDYAPFLDRRCLLGEFVQRAASAVRHSDDGQFQVIRGWAEQVDPCAVTVVETLHKDRESPLEALVQQALDRAWEERLKVQTASSFQTLMKR